MNTYVQSKNTEPCVYLKKKIHWTSSSLKLCRFCKPIWQLLRDHCKNIWLHHGQLLDHKAPSKLSSVHLLLLLGSNQLQNNLSPLQRLQLHFDSYYYKNHSIIKSQFLLCCILLWHSEGGKKSANKVVNDKYHSDSSLSFSNYYTLHFKFSCIHTYFLELSLHFNSAPFFPLHHLEMLDALVKHQEQESRHMC